MYHVIHTTHTHTTHTHTTCTHTYTSHTIHRHPYNDTQGGGFGGFGARGWDDPLGGYGSGGSSSWGGRASGACVCVVMERVVICGGYMWCVAAYACMYCTHICTHILFCPPAHFIHHHTHHHTHHTHHHTHHHTPSHAGSTRPPPSQEDTYTFDQMMNDLGKEFSAWSAQRKSKSGGKNEGREKSLWEELADLGEELVDALEEVCGCVVGVVGGWGRGCVMWCGWGWERGCVMWWGLYVMHRKTGIDMLHPSTSMQYNNNLSTSSSSITTTTTP